MPAAADPMPGIWPIGCPDHTPAPGQAAPGIAPLGHALGWNAAIASRKGWIQASKPKPCALPVVLMCCSPITVSRIVCRASRTVRRLPKLP